MTVLRQLVTGVMGALLSGLLVLGALSVASVEGMIIYTPTAENTATAGLPVPGQDTSTPVPSPTAIQPTNCPAPAGWEGYTLQNGDTLEALSAERGVPVESINQNNCLDSNTLVAGAILFLPPLPTPTLTATPKAPEPTQESPLPSDTPILPTVQVCGPPNNWVTYIVQPGDTLFSLANATGTSVSELMFANCLNDPNYIRVGNSLFLPRMPVRTVPPTTRPTSKPLPTNTPVPPSSTPVPVPPTDIPVPPTDIPATPPDDVPPPVRTDLPPTQSP